jgi:septum formation topological specificity factor MinE
MINVIIRIFRRKKSANVAKERLRMVLSYERKICLEFYRQDSERFD